MWAEVILHKQSLENLELCMWVCGDTMVSVSVFIHCSDTDALTCLSMEEIF